MSLDHKTDRTLHPDSDSVVSPSATASVSVSTGRLATRGFKERILAQIPQFTEDGRKGEGRGKERAREVRREEEVREGQREGKKRGSKKQGWRGEKRDGEGGRRRGGRRECSGHPTG